MIVFANARKQCSAACCCLVGSIQALEVASDLPAHARAAASRTPELNCWGALQCAVVRGGGVLCPQNCICDVLFAHAAAKTALIRAFQGAHGCAAGRHARSQRMRLHGAHTFLAFVACVARCCHQVADACSTHSPSQQPCHSPSERRRRVRLCRLEQPLLCAPARGAVEAASEQLAAISALEECGGAGSTFRVGPLPWTAASAPARAAVCHSSSPHAGHGPPVRSSTKCWCVRRV